MYLHIGTITGVNSSALEVACPTPGIEKFQEISGNKNYGTYRWRFIQGETRGMDLHIGTADNSNSATLEVACPRRELEQILR
jgi:hypothetical protein